MDKQLMFYFGKLKSESNTVMVHFNTIIDRLDHMPSMHYLLIPQRIVEELGGLNNRVVVTVNDRVQFQAGLVALGGGDAYISINKKRMKELEVEAGSEVEVKLEKDNSKYGVPVPEEFEEALNQDTEGKQRFETLAPGNQRYLINHISSAKTSQTRIDRSISVLRNLKIILREKKIFMRF